MKWRYLAVRTCETICFSLAAAISCYGVLRFFISDNAWLTYSLAATAGVVTGVVWVVKEKLWEIDERKIATFINFHYPEWQHSATLLLTPTVQLNAIEQLQQERITQVVEKHLSDIRMPHQVWLALSILILSTTLLWLPVKNSDLHQGLVETQAPGAPSVSTAEVTLSNWEVSIVPPAYTSLAASKSKSSQINVVSGSTLTWALAFSANPEKVFALIAGRDTVLATATEEGFGFQRSATESFVYQIGWSSNGSTTLSDYKAITVREDQPPAMEVKNLAQFTEISSQDLRPISVNVLATDDFGLVDLQLIATVSKGSGEAVKFREETIRFTTPRVIAGKQLLAQTQLDPAQLGMEAGDELYFYVSAKDNRLPVANVSRTETFFIALQDTVQLTASLDDGLGVDLMPEYFRSQRQIIIDSEKILAQQRQKQISKQQFNATSNELGYDQKVLRLRYGQFLGEEFETTVGGHADAEAEHHDHEHEADEEDVTKTFGHQHDTDNEHHLVPEKAGADHEHKHEQHEDGEQKNPFEQFVHSHDNAEEATFFVQSVKAKLKAALALMWDAELHLRMYDPATSLPYQYKVLKLLKEISNDSRIYVHRTGFDPPPIKEDKRLTGDQSEIVNPVTTHLTKPTDKSDVLQRAIELLQLMRVNPGVKITPPYRLVLQEAGNALAAAAIANPAAFLEPLSQLKALMDQEYAQGQRPDPTVITEALWKLLPANRQQPSRNRETLHELDREFLHQLNNEPDK